MLGTSRRDCDSPGCVGMNVYKRSRRYLRPLENGRKVYCSTLSYAHFCLLTQARLAPVNLDEAARLYTVQVPGITQPLAIFRSPINEVDLLNCVRCAVPSESAVRYVWAPNDG